MHTVTSESKNEVEHFKFPLKILVIIHVIKLSDETIKKYIFKIKINTSRFFFKLK